MAPDLVMSDALLGGFVIHGNLEMGQIIAGNYLLLANLCAYAGR